MADRIGRETGQRRDAVGYLFLADSPQREEIIERQRTECADHAQRGEGDAAGRYFGQRNQDHAGVDALEGTDQSRDCEGNDKQARQDAEAFPADPFREATPQRSQQSVHSSSRQGGYKLQAFSSDRGGRPPIAPPAMIHKAKTPRCAVLDKAG